MYKLLFNAENAHKYNQALYLLKNMFLEDLNHFCYNLNKMLIYYTVRSHIFRVAVTYFIEVQGGGHLQEIKS